MGRLVWSKDHLVPHPRPRGRGRRGGSGVPNCSGSSVHLEDVKNASHRNARALRFLGIDASTESQETVNELEQALVGGYRFNDGEREVVRGLVAGASDELIARSLGMRITAVHKLMHRVFAKTRTEGRQALLKLAFRLAARRRIFAPALAAA